MEEEQDGQTLDNEDVQEETETPQTDWQAEAERIRAEKEALEKRYAESSREAQLLHESNKGYKDQINTLTNINVPTDEELKSVYPGFEGMDFASQNFLRDQLSLKKEVAATRKLASDILDKQQREEALNRGIQKYPAISPADFRVFASKQSHKNIDAEILAQAFMFDNKPQAPKANTQGGVLETGSGGAKDAPRAYSAEDIANIRVSDPKKYRELLMKGLI